MSGLSLEAMLQQTAQMLDRPMRSWNIDTPNHVQVSPYSSPSFDEKDAFYVYFYDETTHRETLDFQKEKELATAIADKLDDLYHNNKDDFKHFIILANNRQHASGSKCVREYVENNSSTWYLRHRSPPYFLHRKKAFIMHPYSIIKQFKPKAFIFVQKEPYPDSFAKLLAHTHAHKQSRSDVQLLFCVNPEDPSRTAEF